MNLFKISQLHSVCLPHSTLTRLGDSVVRCYYEFVSQSPLEHIFPLEEDGTLKGGVVLSLEPKSLSRRFFKKNFIRIGAAALRNGLVRDLMASQGPGPAAVQGLPEVTQIFTAPEFQNQHVGSRLLKQTEGFLTSQKIARYYVKTESDPRNPALRFYEKKGFHPVGQGSFGGRPNTYWVKEIKP